jgi:hypothetical protein
MAEAGLEIPSVILRVHHGQVSSAQHIYCILLGLGFGRYLMIPGIYKHGTVCPYPIA